MHRCRVFGLSLIVFAASSCSSSADVGAPATTPSAGSGSSIAASTVPPTIATPTSVPPTVAPTTTSAPCESGADVVQGVQERSIVTSDGETRTFVQLLPDNFDSTQRSDVIFTFHGHGSNGAQQLAYSNFIELAATNNTIIIGPDGGLYNELYGDAPGWTANKRTNDTDIDFVHELIEQLRSEHCIDDVFAAGMSAGGDMTAALACLPDTPFRAFGPVTYVYYNADECEDAPPRPISYFHGTADFVVPLTGNPENAWNDPPVAEVMQRWADHNDCAPDPIEEQFTAEVTRIVWVDCAAPVEWYLVAEGGHTWPGAVDVGLGYTTQEISATEIIWELFQASANVGS